MAAANDVQHRPRRNKVNDEALHDEDRRPEDRLRSHLHPRYYRDYYAENTAADGVSQPRRVRYRADERCIKHDDCDCATTANGKIPIYGFKKKRDAPCGASLAVL